MAERLSTCSCTPLQPCIWWGNNRSLEGHLWSIIQRYHWAALGGSTLCRLVSLKGRGLGKMLRVYYGFGVLT